MNQTKLYPYVTKLLSHCKEMNVTTNEILDKWFHLVINKTFFIFSSKTKAFYKLNLTNFYLDVMKEEEGVAVYLIGFQLAGKLLVNFEADWIFTYHRIKKDLLEEADVFTQNSDFHGDKSNWYVDELERRLEITPTMLLFHDYFGFMEYENQLMSVKAGEQTIRQVKTIYTFNSINQNCNERIPRARCYTECMAQFIIRACQCIPRQLQFDESLVGTFASCSMADYKRCRLGANHGKENVYCEGKCPYFCNQTVLSFDHDIWKEMPSSAESLWFRLKPIFTKHPVFTEVYPQSETAYWADLGGAFDFWIGISVISTAHLIVYFAKQLTYAFRKNTKTGSAVRQLVTGLRKNRMITGVTLGMTERHTEQNQMANVENNNQTMAGLVEQMNSMSSMMANMTEKMDTMSKQLQSCVHEQEQLKSVVNGLQQK